MKLRKWAGCNTSQLNLSVQCFFFLRMIHSWWHSIVTKADRCWYSCWLKLTLLNVWVLMCAFSTGWPVHGDAVWFDSISTHTYRYPKSFIYAAVEKIFEDVGFVPGRRWSFELLAFHSSLALFLCVGVPVREACNLLSFVSGVSQSCAEFPYWNPLMTGSCSNVPVFWGKNIQFTGFWKLCMKRKLTYFN